MKRRLQVKLYDGEPDAYRSQNESKAAVFSGQNFAISYLFTRLRTFEPYSNYHVPETLAEFEFSVKGTVRLEMLPDPAYRGYRRLLGSVFTRQKTREKYTWRSRTSVKAFADLGAARRYLNGDPLIAWSDNNALVMPQEMPAGEDWWLLWQIQDVQVAGGRRFADILADFFSGPSELLALASRQDIVPPV